MMATRKLKFKLKQERLIISSWFSQIKPHNLKFVLGKAEMNREKITIIADADN